MDLRSCLEQLLGNFFQATEILERTADIDDSPKSPIMCLVREIFTDTDGLQRVWKRIFESIQAEESVCHIQK